MIRRIMKRIGAWRRFHFPTYAERRTRGYEYARDVLGFNPSEAAVSRVWARELRIDDDAAWTSGVRAYCEKVRWGR